MKLRHQGNGTYGVYIVLPQKGVADAPESLADNFFSQSKPQNSHARRSPTGDTLQKNGKYVKTNSEGAFSDEIDTGREDIDTELENALKKRLAEMRETP